MFLVATLLFNCSKHDHFFFVYIKDIHVHESHEDDHIHTIEDLFPIGSQCFMLASPYYGASGEVIEIDVKQSRVRVQLQVPTEPDISSVIDQHQVGCCLWLIYKYNIKYLCYTTFDWDFDGKIIEFFHEICIGCQWEEEEKSNSENVSFRVQTPNLQKIWIGYVINPSSTELPFRRICAHKTSLWERIFEGPSSQKFSIGKDIRETMIWFFPYVYLGYVTSLPSCACRSQKAWYFCKLAIKNNWQFSDWARIQYRVSDQSWWKLQLMTVIGQFQKISILIHWRLPYFNLLLIQNSKVPSLYHLNSKIVNSPSPWISLPWLHMREILFSHLPKCFSYDFQSNSCMHSSKLQLIALHAFGQARTSSGLKITACQWTGQKLHSLVTLTGHVIFRQSCCSFLNKQSNPQLQILDFKSLLKLS